MSTGRDFKSIDFVPVGGLRLTITRLSRFKVGGGGRVIHIFVFCPTNFFCNKLFLGSFQKK